MAKKKVLWISDLVVPTGFARVSHSIIKYLDKDEFDIVGLGINYFGDPHSFSFPIYPAMTVATPRDVYGFARLPDLLHNYQPDIIFIINDAWVQKDYLRIIKDFYKKDFPKVITYTPVDAADHDPRWYADFDIATPVAYCSFGKEEIEKASGKYTRVIYHGVDSSTFFKINLPKEEIKKRVYPDRDDFIHSFIVFSGNRNQPRKRLDIALEAFKLFSEGKPENVKLYMHCGIVDSHIDVAYLAARYGIDDRLIVSSMTQGIQTIPDERLNYIYNATDVGINTSIGEGWGLPNMEHAVTGAPQVVPDHSALSSLYSDCGLLVPAKTKHILDNIMTTGYIVRPEDVAEKLELLYRDQALYKQLSEKSISKFTAKEYSWKYIARQWEDLFLE